MNDKQIMNRPRGIMLVTLYSLLTPITLICGGAVILLFGSGLSSIGFLPPAISILGFISLVIAITQLVAIYGLWRFKPWGYQLIRVIYCISILASLNTFLGDPIGLNSFFISSIIGVEASDIPQSNEETFGLMPLLNFALSVYVVIYLSKRNIRNLYYVKEPKTENLHS